MNQRYLLAITLFTSIIFWSVVGWGQILSESFETGLPTSYSTETSYALSSGTWTGTPNQVVRAGDGVVTGDYSLKLRSETNAQIVTPNISQDISTVKFWASSSTASGSLQVNYSTDGGENWIAAEESPFALTNESVVQFTATINSSGGNVLIQFRRTASTVYIDDVEIYGVTTEPTPPTISNISQTPTGAPNAVTSLDAVTVSADITEGDATISNVELRWGTETDTYANTIGMTLGSGSNYTTDTDIPTQTDGTTVYYVIYAEDIDSESSTSTEQSYTVVGPKSATLPYQQVFDVDLGNCYTYTTSGEQVWGWNSNGAPDGSASISGKSGSALENVDWLITPNFDFTGVADIRFVFDETITDGNAIDAEQEVYVSTNYLGVGDPANATWTKLTVSNRATDGNFISVDESDLSTYAGESNVHIGFKYTSTTLAAATWQVDNVKLRNGDTPLLSSEPNSLSDFSYAEGSGPSASQSFSLSGVSLDGTAVTITAPANFEVSDAEAGPYASSLSLTAFDGAETDIWVRLASGLTPSSYSGDIAITGGGADEINVSLSGEVTIGYEFVEAFDNYPETSGSYEEDITTGFDGVASNTWFYVDARGDKQIDNKTVTLRDNTTTKLYSTITGGISQFSFDYMQAFSTDVNLEVYVNSNLVATVTSNGETGIVKNSGNIDIEDVSGAFLIEFKQGIGGGQVAIDNFSWNGVESTDPYIVALPLSLAGFSYIENSGPSSAQFFEIYGENLNGDVIITAPSNFEVSDSEAGTYASAHTLSTYNGNPTNIWVRLVAGLAAGEYSGDVQIAGGGLAENVMVAVSGKVVEPFGIPYSNDFRNQENYDKAILQGFIATADDVRETADPYLLFNINEYVETPTIDFTAFDELFVEYSMQTYGSGDSRTFTISISTDNGASYSEIASEPVPASFETFSSNIDLTEAYNSSSGKLRFEMNAGSGGQTRFRDLEIRELISATFNPSTAEFDLNNPQDITTTITWNDASSVSGILLGATPLTKGEDYTVVDNTITILSAYLTNAEVGDKEFIVSFNQGNNAIFTVSVVEITPTYPVSFSVVEVESQTNGTLSAKVDEVAIASGNEVEEGKDVVFTANPNFGFRVKDWLVDNISVSETSKTYTLSSLAGAVDVKVEFELIPTYPVTFNVDMTPAGTFTSANIKGDNSFGGYYPGLQELIQLGDWYTVTLNLPDGTYNYKYYIDDESGVEGIATSRSITVTGEGKNINDLWGDTDVGAAITPATRNYDLTNPTNVSTNIKWYAATDIISINDGNVDLIETDHYTLVGNTLTIKDEYLTTKLTAEEQSVVLEITFDAGETLTFTVSAIKTVIVNAEINPTIATFDKHNPTDLVAEITWNDATTISKIELDGTELVSDTDYTLDGTTLTYTQAYLSGLSPAEGEELVFTITFDVGNPATYTVTILESATINPVAASFDLWSPTNVETTITWNGATSIESVSKGGTDLLLNTDYQVAGDKLTILESFFDGTAIGDVFELVATFDIGATATLTLTVIDTEPNHATINPVSAEFDKYAPANVTTTITWNDAPEISSIKVGATELALTEHYTVTDIDGATATLTIFEGYFSEVAVGDIVFDITFDVGNPSAVTVTVADNSPVAYPITIATVVGGIADISTSPVTEAFKDDEVTVTIANIEDGKEFHSIEVTAADESVISTTQVTEGAEYTFTMPEQAVSVTVSLADIPVPSEFVDFEIDSNWSHDGGTALSNYGNHNYSDLGVTIGGTNVLRNGKVTQDGFSGAIGDYSMRIRNEEGAKAVVTVAEGGVANFSFKVRRWDASPMPDYTVKYSVDGGTTWVGLPNIDGDLLATSNWYSYNGNINSEKTNILIEIANTGSTERIMIDNFDWDGYVDTYAPEPTFTPANGATDVLATINPTISFNEPVFLSSGVAVDNSNVAGLISFTGADAVPFSATITDNLISIVPNARLDFDTQYTLTINALEDDAGNKMSSPASITFTTLSASLPVVTLTITYNSDIYYSGDDVQVSWNSENVANINIELWSSIASQWVTLKDNIDASRGTAMVKLPADAAFAKDYKLRLKDADSDTYSAESDGFTIRPVVTDILSIRGFDDNVEFRFDGEAVVTYTRENRNQKYIQDGGAAVIIDDELAVITSTYTIGDVVTGLEAKKSTYNGIAQVVPLADPGVPAQTADVVPFIRTIDAITTNDQSKLIRISDAEFTETGNFSGYSNYTVTDPSSSEITFRAGFAEANYIDQPIPEGKLKSLVAIVGEHNGTPQITSRSTEDFELYSNDASLSTFALGGQNVLSLEGIQVTDPETDAGAKLNIVDFTNFAGIEVIASNANATVQVKLNGAVIDFSNLSNQPLANGDVVVATVTAENESTVNCYKVTVSNQPSSEANILSFSFAEQIGNAVIADGTIAVEVAHDVDITALVASFTLSVGASAKVDDVTQESGVTSNNFTIPVTYIVTAQDGSTSKEWVVTVTQADEVKHTVTFSVVGGDGNISATVDNVDIVSGDDVVAGSAVTFTAEPAPGHRVKEWNLNGAPVADNTTNQFTIASLNANTEVTVEFEAITQDTYTVTFSVADGMGNISAAVGGSNIVSGDDVDAGSEVVFTAEPAPSYQVKEWTLNGAPVSDNSTNEFVIANLDVDVTVTVEFEEVVLETYTVTFSVVEIDGATNGTLIAAVNEVELTSGDEVEEGSAVVFTATPNDGYKVKTWTLNGDPIADFIENSYSISELTIDVVISVEFEVITSVPTLSLSNVKTYPNPFTNTIKLDNSELVSRVIVTDMIGKQVMMIDLNGENVINTSSLREGVYLIILENQNGQRVVRRMIKR